MESREYQEARVELYDFFRDHECSICQQGVQRSASTSYLCHDINNSQRTTGHSTATSIPPNPVTAVQPQLSNQATEVNNEPNVSTKSPDKTICDYLKTTCKVVTCRKSLDVKCLLEHLRSEHTLMAFAPRGFDIEFTVSDGNPYQAIPLYILGNIFWEVVHYYNNDIRISFFHESPNVWTPSLKAHVSVECKHFGMEKGVRVMKCSHDPRREEVIIPLLGGYLTNVKGSGAGSSSDDPVKVKHRLTITRHILM